IIIALICLNTTSFGQVVVNEGFEHGGALPTGWSAAPVSGTYNFVCVSAYILPPVMSAHGGSYWMSFQSWSTTTSADLFTSVIDWSGRGGVTTTVTAWFYRQTAICAGHNDNIAVYVNTSAS